MASCWARKCENYVLIVLYFVLLVIVCHGIVLSPFEWWWATSTISRYSLTAYPMFIFSLFCEDVLQPFLKKWPEKWWVGELLHRGYPDWWMWHLGQALFPNSVLENNLWCHAEWTYWANTSRKIEDTTLPEMLMVQLGFNFILQYVGSFFEPKKLGITENVVGDEYFCKI